LSGWCCSNNGYERGNTYYYEHSASVVLSIPSSTPLNGNTLTIDCDVELICLGKDSTNSSVLFQMNIQDVRLDLGGSNKESPELLQELQREPFFFWLTCDLQVEQVLQSEDDSKEAAALKKRILTSIFSPPTTGINIR
jgi:hypothetical protein